MKQQEVLPSGMTDAALPVCPQAFDRLWQAAYGAAVSLPHAADRTAGVWRPFDAGRPLMPLLRVCAAHLHVAHEDTAVRAGLQARLLQLSVWLCSDEARTGCGRFAAWARDGADWRLIAVHRDLLRQAAACRALAVTRPYRHQQGACPCLAIS